MSDPTLVKLLLVAIELLEWYHSNIQSAAELWRKQTRHASNLLLLMPTFFVPITHFQQIVACVLYTTVWLNLHRWSQSASSRTSWINRFKRFQVTRLTWPELCKKKRALCVPTCWIPNNSTTSFCRRVPLCGMTSAVGRTEGWPSHPLVAKLALPVQSCSRLLT